MSSLSVQIGDVDSIVRAEFPKKKHQTKFKPKPKPKVRPKKPIERIFGSKEVVKEHNFSKGVKINEKNQRDLLKEPSPFVYPKDLEEYSFKVINKEWRERLRQRELKQRYNVRNNYQSRQNLDILNRLWVKDPQEQSMRTIFDIDPDYFTIVEGRPIAEKFNIKDYINDMREILRTRIVTGYKEDEILLINENFIDEQKAIDNIKTKLQKYVEQFEDFLYNDHTTSMDLLRTAEKEAAAASEKYEIFRSLSTDYGALRAQVSGLEEKWRTLKLYQKFCYILSPMAWREEHDYYHFKRDRDEVIPDPSVLFDNKFGEFDDIQSLHELIEVFLDDCRTQDEPKLYFKEPIEMLKVFRFMEIQNLNSLLHTEELALPLENVRNGMEQARKKFDEEIVVLREMVENLEGEILWQEMRALLLEELAQVLIESEFCKVISDEEVLNLHVFIEDVYETRVAPNDANLGIADMMKGIELCYRKYLLKLDYLPQDKVHKAESECYAEEAKIMKMAKDAARKVEQIERLARRLERVLEPPFERVYKGKFLVCKMRVDKCDT